jgi:hypothetical protein
MTKDPDSKPISGTWVHAFEQDSPEGAVFRPEHADIPLSRRPRERVELHEDGTAVLLMPGPDDGYVGQPARWSEEGDAIVVRDAKDRVRLRIVESWADKLIVQMPRPGAPR